MFNLISTQKLFLVFTSSILPLMLIFSILSCTSKVNELDDTKKEESQVEAAGCKGKECQVCVLPWGDVLPHGQVLKNAFKKELAGCDEQCDSLAISLECESGTLLQVTRTERLPFKGQAFKSCYKKTCNCTFKDQIIPDGLQKNFFKTSSKICDDKCEKKSLLCLSGKLVDPLSPTSAVDLTKEYSYLSCDQLPCAKCLTPWSDQINSGVIVSGFKNATLTCKESCTGSGNKKDFTCYNGGFKESGIASYANKTCALNACRQCDLPCGKTINDGENSYCFNTSKSTTCGDTNCSSNNVRFYCSDGTLKNSSGTVLDSKNYTAYSAPSCTADDCRKCKAVWGTEYLSSSTFYGYKDSSVACGKDCNTTQNRNLFKCDNGDIKGGINADFPNDKCTVTDCKPCTLPCGKSVSSGGHNTCYSMTAPKICGDTCYRNSKDFYCFDGIVTDSNKVETPPAEVALYSNSTCADSNVACIQCKTPEGKIIDDSKKVTFYKNNLVECTDSCLSTSNAVTLTCSDGQFGNKVLYPDFNHTTCKSKCDGVADGNRGIGRITGDGGGAPVYLCRLPWSREVATHNTEVTAYSKGSVPKGSTCEPYKKVITCNAYRGLWTGGAVYIYPTCYVEK